MRFGAIGDLVTDPRGKHELTPISQFGVQFSLEAEQNVSLGAPVISEVARGVLDHAHTQIAEGTGLPLSEPLFALVTGALQLRPISEAKRQVRNFHDALFTMFFSSTPA